MHKEEIMIDSNLVKKKFKLSFRVLTVTIRQAMFNHNGSLEAACVRVINEVGE